MTHCLIHQISSVCAWIQLTCQRKFYISAQRDLNAVLKRTRKIKLFLFLFMQRRTCMKGNIIYAKFAIIKMFYSNSVSAKLLCTFYVLTQSALHLSYTLPFSSYALFFQQ